MFRASHALSAERPWGGEDAARNDVHRGYFEELKIVKITWRCLSQHLSNILGNMREATHVATHAVKSTLVLVEGVS